LLGNGKKIALGKRWNEKRKNGRMRKRKTLQRGEKVVQRRRKGVIGRGKMWHEDGKKVA
jgi:hypothetical protein